MIKKAISEVLNTTVIKYIKDLDVNALTISIWEGQINLPRNLKLDIDSINKDYFCYDDSNGNENSKVGVGLVSGLVNGVTSGAVGIGVGGGSNSTVEVEDWEINLGDDSKDSENEWKDVLKRNIRLISGSIGKISIDVPWANIASNPVVIRVSNVNLVFGLVVKPSTVLNINCDESMSNISEDNYSHGRGNKHQRRYSKRGTTTTTSKRANRRPSFAPSISTSSTTASSTATTSQKNILPSVLGQQLRNLNAKNRKESDKKKARRDSIIANDNKHKRHQELKRLILPTTTSSTSKHDKSNSYSSKLVRRILENLQLDFTDIHVKLMDPDVLCAGLIIESISFDTTDEHGRRILSNSNNHNKNSFVPKDGASGTASGGTGAQLFKALRISNLGVYLETAQEYYYDTNDDISISNNSHIIIDDSISLSSANTSAVLNRNYIIPPLSFEAAYHQSESSNTSSEEQRGIVQHLLFSQLPHLSLVISRTQLLLLHEIIKCIAPATAPSSKKQKPLFPQYRPWSNIPLSSSSHQQQMNCSIKKQWWRYAYKCILRLSRRTSWLTFMKAFRIRKRYMELYGCFLDTITTLTKEGLDEMRNIEEDKFISVKGIVRWRSMVVDQAPPPTNATLLNNTTTTTKKIDLSKRFTTFLQNKRSNHNNTQNNEEDEEDTQLFFLSEEDKLELDSQLDYPFNNSHHFYNHSSQNQQIEIELSIEYIILDILEGSHFNSQPIAKLRFGAVDAGFSFKRCEISYALSLLSFQIEDLKTLSPMFPTVVRSIHDPTNNTASKDIAGNGTNQKVQQQQQQSKDAALHIRFSKNIKNGDISLKLRMIAFEIVFSTCFITNILEFISLETSHSTTSTASSNDGCLGSILSDGIIGVTKYLTSSISTNLFQNIWKQKKIQRINKILVDCRIDAPVFVFPYDIYDPDTTVLIIDLGTHYIYSPNIIPKVVQDYFQKNNLHSQDTNNCEEGWVVESEQVTIFLGSASAFDWLQVKEYSLQKSLNHGELLLKPFSFTLNIGTCSKEDSIAVFMNSIVTGLMFSIEPQELFDVYSILQNVCDVSGILQQPTTTTTTKKTTPPIIQKRKSLEMIFHEEHFPKLLEKRNPNKKIVQELYCYSITFARSSIYISIGIFGMLELHIANAISSFTKEYYLGNNSSTSSCNTTNGDVGDYDESISTFIIDIDAFWMTYKTKPSNPARCLLHSTLPIDQTIKDYTVDDIFQMIHENTVPNLLVNKLKVVLEPYQQQPQQEGSLVIVMPPSNDNNIQRVSIYLTLSNIAFHWFPSIITPVIESFQNIRKSNNNGNTKDSSSMETSNSTSISFTSMFLESFLFLNPISTLFLPALVYLKNIASQEKVKDHIKLKTNISSFQFKLFNLGMEMKPPILSYYLSDFKSTLDLRDENTTNFFCDIGDMYVDIQLRSTILPTYTRVLYFTAKTTKMEGVIEVKYNKAILRNEVNSLEKLHAGTSIKIAPFSFVYSVDALQYFLNDYKDTILGSIFTSFVHGFSWSVFNICYSPMGEQVIDFETHDSIIILPQTLSKPYHFLSKIDEMNLMCDLFPFRGGGKAKVNFKGICLQTEDEVSIVREPISLKFDISIPPVRMNVKEQYAIKVYTEISNISSVWNKKQYLQALSLLNGYHTLLGNDEASSCNNSLQDNRNDTLQEENDDDASDSDYDLDLSSPDFTIRRIKGFRTGEKLDIAKRASVKNFRKNFRKKVVLNLKFGLISCKICSTDMQKDPICDVVLENPLIALKMNFIEDIMNAEVTVGHYEVDDLRMQDNKLLRCSQVIRSSWDIVEGKSSCKLSFERYSNKRMDVSFVIDAVVRVLILPDFVSDVCQFLDFDPPGHQRICPIDKGPTIYGVWDCYDFAKRILIVPSAEFKFVFKTNEVKVVFVEFFSSHLIQDNNENQDNPNLDPFSCVTLRYKTDAEFTRIIKYDGGQFCVQSEAEIKLYDLQVYKAHRKDFSHPIQILEPSNIAFVISLSSSDLSSSMQFDIVSTSLYDCSVSIQDMTLIAAIWDEVEAHLFIDSMPLWLKKRLKDAFAFCTRTVILSDTVDFHVNMNLPSTTIVVINDFDRHDDAVLKFKSEQFGLVGSGGVSLELSENEGIGTISPLHIDMLDYTFSTSFNCDYFDVWNLSWNSLIEKPLVLSFSSKRNKVCTQIDPEGRYHTSINLDVLPCFISFTYPFVQYLVQLQNNWSVFSQSKDIHRLAYDCASVSMPHYGLENRTGIDIVYKISHDETDHHSSCQTTKYLSFNYVKQEGVGAKRVYGQDTIHKKKIVIYPQNASKALSIGHLDSELSRRRVIDTSYGKILSTEVVRTENRTVLRLRSRILIYNETQLPFEIFVQCKDASTEVGTLCCSKPKSIYKKAMDKGTQYLDRECIGIPDHMLEGYFSSPSSKSSATSHVGFLFSPPMLLLRVSRKHLNCKGNDNDGFWARIVLPSHTDLHRVGSISAPNHQTSTMLNLQFKPENSSLLPGVTDMVVHAVISIRMVDDHPLIDISLQPRLVLQNNLPLSIMVRTPDAHTLSPLNKQTVNDEEFEGQTLHFLKPLDSIQIFSCRDSIRISTKFADEDDCGASKISTSNWMKGEFVELHLGERKFHHDIEDEIVCSFPSGNQEQEIRNSTGFLIVENTESLSWNDRTSTGDIDASTISLAVPIAPSSMSMIAQCIIVDHVERFCIESVCFQTDRASEQDSKQLLSSEQQFSVLSAFSSRKYPRFVLLPDTTSHVRICTDNNTVQMTHQLQSNPFKIDGIELGIGGFESSQLFWEDLVYSGYYIYRKVVDMGILVTELHIIPEYMINNSTDFSLIVTYNDPENTDRVNLTLAPQQRAPLVLSQSVSNVDLHIKIEVPEKGYFTNPITVDDLNEQVCELYCNSDVISIANSLAVKETLTIVTKVGKESERILINIGPFTVKRTSQAASRKELSASSKLNSQDDHMITFLLKCQQVHVKIQITEPPDGFIVTKFDDFRVKYQRLFLCDVGDSPVRDERSQLTICVGSMNLNDSDESESYQPVLRCPDSNCIFLDFSLLYRGSLFNNSFTNDEKLLVDKLNFNLGAPANRNEKQELRLQLNLYSEFFSRLMLFINLLATNTAEYGGTVESSEDRFKSLMNVIENNDDNGIESNFEDEKINSSDFMKLINQKAVEENEATTKTRMAFFSPGYFSLFDRLLYFNLIVIGSPEVDIRCPLPLSDPVRIRSVEDGREVVFLKHFINECQLSSSSNFNYPATTLAFKNLSCCPKTLVEVIVSSLKVNLKNLKLNSGEDDWIADSSRSSVKKNDANNQWNDLEAFAHIENVAKKDIQCNEEEEFQRAIKLFDNEDVSVTQSNSSGDVSTKGKKLFSFFQ